MGDKNQSKIIKHHDQVNGKVLRQLKKKYERERRYNEKKRAGLILKQKAALIKDIFFTIYFICLITSLLSALIYALGELYGF